MKDYLISEENYKRIFETIYSVLDHLGFPPEKNCVYFSIISAYILYDKFGVECKSYSGAASYYVDSQSDTAIAFIEKIGENRFVGSINGFHSWNENNTHVIDFQAPLFPELLKKIYGIEKCPRKMFQRRVSERCMSPQYFKKDGDFFHSPNPELGKLLVDRFVSLPLNMDILRICNSWFKDPIGKMEDQFEVKDENGLPSFIELKKMELFGSW